MAPVEVGGRDIGGSSEAHFKFAAGDRVKLTRAYVQSLRAAAEQARCPHPESLPAVGATGTVLFSPRTGHVVRLDDSRAGFRLIRRESPGTVPAAQPFTAVIVPTWGLLAESDPEVDGPEGEKEETTFSVGVTLSLLGVSARKVALALDVSNTRVSFLLNDFRYYWLPKEGYRVGW